MRTNQEYINEFSIFDDFIETAESCNKDMACAVYDYNNMKHNLEMKAFFEGVDADVLFEKESDSFLTKIGKTVIAFIEALGNAIKSFTDKILSTTHVIKSDQEIVTKIIAEHPEYKDIIMKGIKKEWFTYRDVAQYEKDVVGLVNMLDKNAIDHATFIEKLGRSTKKFKESASPIIVVGETIGGLRKCITETNKFVNEGRDSINSLHKAATVFKRQFETNYARENMGVIQSTWNALQDAIGLCVDECKDRTKKQGKLGSWLSAKKTEFLEKHGDSAIGRAIDKHDAKKLSKRIAKRDELDKREKEAKEYRDNMWKEKKMKELDDLAAKKKFIEEEKKKRGIK